MRRLLVGVIVLALSMMCSSVFADEGGYKDPQTGKVWSPPMREFAGSVDWAFATQFAANYSVWDWDANNVWTQYADWRLPTVNELMTGFANGIVQLSNNNSPAKITGVRSNWTSEKKGSHRWAVRVKYDDSGVVIEGPTAQLMKAPGGPISIIEAIMIRP